MDFLQEKPKELWEFYSYNISISVLSILHKKEISLSNFAKQLAISEEKLKELLSGKTNFSLSDITKFSEILNERLITIHEHDVEMKFSK